MANDLNQCNFIGRLARDPEVRYLPSGKAVANFSIAVGWKTKDKEGVEWVSITAFDKLGEICGQHLKKGSQVFISGRFNTEKYTDKDGNERYSTKIIADTMQMLGSKQGGNADQNDDHHSAPSHRSKTMNKQAPNIDDMNDDIPF